MDNVNGRVVKTRRAVHEIVVACLKRVRADRELSHVQQKGLPCAAFSVNQNDYHDSTFFDASVAATHCARTASLKNLRRNTTKRKVTDFISTNVGHHRMMEPPNKHIVDRMTRLRVLYLSYHPGPPLNELSTIWWLIEGGKHRAWKPVVS